MAKRVIKYFLQGDGTVPPFVDNGGYFPVGFELTGVSVDEAQRYVPDTVIRCTRADLLAQVKASLKDANGVYLSDINGVQYTDASATAMMDAWLTQVGMSNLA